MKFLAISILALSLAGCCTSSGSLNKSRLNYNINFGSSGGFTGNSDGYLIDTSGAITQWTGKTFESSKLKVIGNLSSEGITELNELITSQNIIHTEYRKPGNMTQFIILTNNSTEHHLSWEGLSLTSDLPQNIQIFYKKLNELVSNSTK